MKYFIDAVWRDKTGREIKPGDLLKVPHFVEYRRRRKIYMHKLVVRCNSDLQITPDGQHLFCVDVCDIARRGLGKAHRCPLGVIGECEIIDGGTVTTDDLFWERPMIKEQAS